MRSRDVLGQQNIRSPLAFPFFQHFLPVSGDVCVAYSTSWRNATIMTTVAAFVQVIFKVGLPAVTDGQTDMLACVSLWAQSPILNYWSYPPLKGESGSRLIRQIPGSFPLHLIECLRQMALHRCRFDANIMFKTILSDVAGLFWVFASHQYRCIILISRF